MSSPASLPEAGEQSRTEPSSAATRSGRIALVAACGLAIVALAMRLVDLSHESIWLDEAYTLLFSGLPVAKVISIGGAHEHPPLFYLLVHLGLTLGKSYLVPRVLAAVAGALCVLVLYLLGAEIFDRPTGLLAAAMLTISPLQLWYSEDGRAYELAGLLLLVSYLSVLKWVRSSDVRWLLLYTASVVLAVYTDYTSAIALVPQVIFLAPARRARQQKLLLAAWGVSVLAYLPWVGYLAADVSSVAQGYWIPPPNPSVVASTIFELLGLMTPCPTGTACVSSASLLVPTGAAAVLSAALIGAVLCVTAVHACRRRRLGPLTLTLWILFPFVLLLAVSALRPLFLDRYVLSTSFPLYLLVAAGITWSLRRRRAVLLAVAGLAVILAGGFDARLIYATQTNPDWKTPVRDLEAAYRPGQAVAYYPGVLRTVLRQYGARRWHPTAARAIWLHTYIDVPVWGRTLSNLDDYQLRDLQLSELTQGKRQVWLVAQQYIGMWDVWHWLTSHGFYYLLNETYAGGTQLQLWDRRPPQQFGARVIAPGGFGQKWRESGSMSARGGVATVHGPATLTRVFPVRPGVAYTVSTDHRSFSLPEPTAQVRVYRTCAAAERSLAAAADASLGTYPQVPHYDLWVTRSWVSKAFGFIAPPGAHCGVLQLKVTRGRTDWQRVGVYRER